MAHRTVPTDYDELTVRGIERLPFPERPDRLRDYPDKRVPGLSLRLFDSGRRSWYLKYRQHGRQRRYKLGDYPTLGLSDARKKAEKMRVDVREGADPVRERRERNTAETFGELVETYLTEFAPDALKPASRTEKARILRGRDVSGLRELVPADITPHDVARALDRIERRASLVMLNRTQSAISTVFRWAVERRLAGLEANPVRQLETRHTEDGSERWLSGDEVAAVWDDIDQRTMGAPAALKLVLVTAQRPGEVAAVEWRHLDGTTWSMPTGYRKFKRRASPPHDVHLSELALAILDGVGAHYRKMKVSGHRRFVFPGDGPGGHIDPKALTHAVRRTRNALRKSGSVVERWKAHDLRRTATTHMRKYLGVDRLTVQKVLGHSDRDVTGVYDRHDMWEERAAALDAWADRLIQLTA